MNRKPTSHEGLFLAMNQAWRDYHCCLRACRKNPKTKAIHEIRISLRRLIVLMEVLQALEKNKAAKKLRKELKDELHELRDLRDYQNQEKEFDRLLGKSELKAFRRDLCQKRKREERRIRDYFKSLPAKKTNLAIQAQGETLLGTGRAPSLDSRARRVLKRAILSRYRSFQNATRRARADDLPSIHRARIEFKKFRYIQEELSGILPLSQSRKASLRRVQTLLGDIQDYTVGLRLLSEYMIDCAKTPPDPELQRVQRMLEKQQEEKVAEFLPGRVRLLSQVRPTQVAA